MRTVSLSWALFAFPLISGAPLDSSGSAKEYPRNVVKSERSISEQNGTVSGNILPTTPINSELLLSSTIQEIRTELKEIDEIFATFAGLFQQIVSIETPNSIPDAMKQIGNLYSSATSGSTVALQSVAEALLNGISVTDLTQTVLGAYLSDINSFSNNNNPPPLTSVYPKSSSDATYNVPEASLRAALYIPPAFTFGQKRPIRFVPGTGAYGGVNFISNLGKLLAQDYDPVYLNVPGAMYNDTQVNSEYIAYAMNYISSLTSRSQNRNNLAVIGWSQGNPDTQWAYQYWPSTRSTTTDFISISADFHGTVLAYFLDPAFPDVIPNPPSIIQQEYDSNYIRTLRAGGGDSPYVPSTSIWSITDEIVEPQYNPVASAAYFSQDLPGSTSTCKVNVTSSNNGTQAAYTNNQIQTICAGRPAGGIYTHEGALYNPLAYALVLDALQNDGPGEVSRINLDVVCSEVVAPGLSLDDVLATEGLIPLAAINLLLYPEKVLSEPATMAYALQDLQKANTCATGASSLPSS